MLTGGVTTQADRKTHSDARDEVSSLVVISAGSRALNRRSHAVLIILAYEDARQLPQCRHVEGLKQLALVTDRQTDTSLDKLMISLNFLHKI